MQSWWSIFYYTVFRDRACKDTENLTTTWRNISWDMVIFGSNCIAPDWRCYPYIPNVPQQPRARRILCFIARGLRMNKSLTVAINVVSFILVVFTSHFHVFFEAPDKVFEQGKWIINTFRMYLWNTFRIYLWPLFLDQIFCLQNLSLETNTRIPRLL